MLINELDLKSLYFYNISESKIKKKMQTPSQKTSQDPNATQPENINCNINRLEN